MYFIYVIKCLRILLENKKSWEIILQNKACEIAFIQQIFFLKIFIFSIIVDLQCFVNFCCTAK